MEKILLIIVMMIIKTSIQAQNSIMKLDIMNEFYKRTLEIKKEDSIKYHELQKKLERQRGGESIVNKFSDNYWITIWTRDHIKGKMDSIIKVVKRKNLTVSKDSISIVKISNLNYKICEGYNLIVKYPQYGFCDIKVKDTLIKFSHYNKSLSKNKTYYFMEKEELR